ncbi:MAG TPA: class I SAM-dependent methyltransferase [Nocardioidaceae bacterium]|nr:class I SAM-dependent methyltransferase [Nocardioidaceae bacterium]
MDEPHNNLGKARSFDNVVNTYDRGRPAYPDEAARWLTGPGQARVLELGAGTGKLTAGLVTHGQTVIATDPSEPMLRRLVERVPGAHAVLASAERMPVASGSVDVVVAAQAFHWFDSERVLPEIARVLKPRGALALIWNERDERIPWVRRLGAIIGEKVGNGGLDPSRILDDSGLFETVQRSTFRFWQPTTRQSLHDLVLSRSNVAVLTQSEREQVIGKVDGLYDDYGRGHDGMLMPYVTHAYRAVVLPWAVREDVVVTAGQVTGEADGTTIGPDDPGTDSLLIDFR